MTTTSTKTALRDITPGMVVSLYRETWTVSDLTRRNRDWAISLRRADGTIYTAYLGFGARLQVL